jgi:quercetin dioxygenase-like cupin family protein
MSLQRWNTERDGEISEAAMRRKLAAMGYSVHTYTYPPGTSFSPHTHDVDKIDGVISGRFEITIDQTVFLLGPGDCLPVPRGVRHSARVIGSEPVVSVDAVKTKGY